MTSPDFVEKTKHITEAEEEIEAEVERDLDETEGGPLKHQVGAEDTTDPREEE